MNNKLVPGRGIDIGTGFLVVAQATEDGSVITKSVRDSFLELTPPNKIVYGTMKKGLLKAGVNFFEGDGKFYVLGDDSLTQSVERQAVARRPMAKGVISPLESQALPMFKALLKELLGEPLIPGEKVVYSIPAAPIDASFDVVYHTKVIESILSSLGYTGTPLNEAQAIVLSELDSEEDSYTGAAISFGAGSINLAISNMADCIHKFSISKSGDYIDEATALSLGFDPSNPKNSIITPSLVTFVKEQGIDILNPGTEDSIKIGLAAHYKHLISYVVSKIGEELKRSKVTTFTKPITVVISGGTSLAGNFLKVMTAELFSQQGVLPFKIKEVRHAKNPLTAVAEGCLIALLAEEG